MPGPKPRLHLPYAAWPSADRLLWQQRFGSDDPFADVRLAKATQDHCMWAWRRFLGFLHNNEPEALEIAPAERLTIERAKLFVVHLAESNTANSVAMRIEGLYMAAHAMIPDRDWTWLKKVKLRLRAAVRAHSPGRPVITSVHLLEVGLKLMDENRPGEGVRLNVHQAVAYRHGLMCAILAFAPIRPKNLTSLEIKRHIIVERDRWFIIIPREETKTQKRIRFEIPKLVVPYLGLYLAAVRPTLLQGRTHNALWVSIKGGALSYIGVVKSFVQISLSLGMRISPHDARDAAVTTWAIARPDQIAVSRDLLYHSKLDTTSLYNRARGIEASRAYRQVIRELRNEPSIGGNRSRAVRF